MHQNHNERNFSRQSAGFSLFELVVFILSVAIIYSLAANRFAGFPAQAERANFLAVTAQIQTAVNLELMLATSRQNQGALQLMVGINPMDLLLEVPSNYIGAYESADEAAMPRRSWYFDRSRGQLVYLVENAEGVLEVGSNGVIPTDSIRFSVVTISDQIDTRTGLPVTSVQGDDYPVLEEHRRRRVKGVAFRPTVPFRWEAGSVEELTNEAVADR